MIIFDDLTLPSGLVFDDLNTPAVTTYLQQGDASLALAPAATQDTDSIYEQLFQPELILAANSTQEFVAPVTAVAYLQAGNARILFFLDAVQEHIAVAAGEEGQTANVVLKLSGDAYQQYIEGTNPGEVLQQANAQVWLLPASLQSWEAPPPEVVDPEIFTQAGDAQLVFTSDSTQAFVAGSNFLTTVAEFIDELLFDELSDMFIGNRHAVEEVRPKLLPLMNTAMTYAYAKWEGLYRTTKLSLEADKTDYQLRNADILQIIEIHNVYGIEIPQNEYRVIGQSLRFYYPSTQEVQIVYKAKHPKYTLAQDDTQVLVALPDMLMPWLKAYVCYRYFSSMKNADAQAKAMDFLAQATMHENMFVQTNTTNEFTALMSDKMTFRGFC